MMTYAPELLALAILVALNAYVLTAGADFGGGVWDLLATGPRRERQRTLVAHAIGPIWEANHVWLILVVVLLFTCFPPVFAALSVALHVPLTLALVGIVMRGAAFAFRSAFSGGGAEERAWGRVFSVASTVTPVLLGMMVGAIATGRVGEAAARVARNAGAGSFANAFVRPWLSPFTVAVGFLALALFALLAAAYLCVEAEDEALREDFRRRALGAWAASAVLALLALVLARLDRAHVGAALTREALALPLHAATAAAALAALWALATRRWRLARAAAAAQASLVLWGWALAQRPYLLPPDLSVRAAAAPERTLLLALGALALGAAALVPSLWYLFAVFKSGAPGRRAGAGSRRAAAPGPREP
jgi:cytochrome bd ubiquinol oxidase subunit II